MIYLSSIQNGIIQTKYEHILARNSNNNKVVRFILNKKIILLYWS